MPYIHVSNLHHVIILYHITSCFYITVFIPLKRAESPCSAFRASLSVVAGMTDPRNGRHSLTMAFTFRRQHINLVPRRQPKSLGGRDVAREGGPDLKPKLKIPQMDGVISSTRYSVNHPEPSQYIQCWNS